MIMTDLERCRGGQCICRCYSPMTFPQMHQDMDIWLKFLVRFLVCKNMNIWRISCVIQILRGEPLFNHQAAQSSVYLMQLVWSGCMCFPQQTIQTTWFVFFAGMLWMIHSLWLVICLQASADGHSITSFLYKQYMSEWRRINIMKSLSQLDFHMLVYISHPVWIAVIIF